MHQLSELEVCLQLPELLPASRSDPENERPSAGMPAEQALSRCLLQSQLLTCHWPRPATRPAPVQRVLPSAWTLSGGGEGLDTRWEEELGRYVSALCVGVSLCGNSNASRGDPGHAGPEGPPGNTEPFACGGIARVWNGETVKGAPR